MIGGRILLAAAAIFATGAAGGGPVAALAGRYSETQHLALVSGEEYRADDVAEIVPVDARHAYLRLALNFYNGHSCSLVGVAQVESDSLVYRGSADDRFADGEPCRLAVRRQGTALTWDDAGTCKAHCGARGSFLNGTLPWKSKRPIRYLERLKASTEYRDAIAEWRR